MTHSANKHRIRLKRLPQVKFTFLLVTLKLFVFFFYLQNEITLFEYSLEFDDFSVEGLTGVPASETLICVVHCYTRWCSL